MTFQTLKTVFLLISKRLRQKYSVGRRIIISVFGNVMKHKHSLINLIHYGKHEHKDPYTRRVWQPGVLLQEQASESICTASTHWETHDGLFSRFFILPRDLAPKNLTGLMLSSILQGGYPVPVNELRPWNRWYTRGEFSCRACPWSKTLGQNPSCVSPLTLFPST